MEELYLSIAEHLREKMPELATIDEDTGQLVPSDEEDGYPILFPCVLISTDEINWETVAGGKQRGSCLITIKHAFDCYEDTHILPIIPFSFSNLRERSEAHRKLCSFLHQYTFIEGMKPLIRKQSRSYTLLGRIKVYEEIFSCTVSDGLLPCK